MIEELLPELYKIDVPLPDSPLKTLNAYLVKGRNRHLLIDNGFNRPECREALFSALADLDADTGHMDFFITHRHSDHCGLTSELATDPEAAIWCSADDSYHINKIIREGDRYWPELIRAMLPHGFNSDDMEQLLIAHPAKRFAPTRPLRFSIAKDGDRLFYGRYTFIVLSTPGHTPDHLCLYEPDRQLLFSGDHILGGITPNITRWRGFPDALGQYLRSLEALRVYPIRQTLPGHRALIADTHARIAVLKEHHEKRLDEIMAILDEGEKDACTVASRMHWSIRAASWDDFPVSQRWFASGEALAHLEHLVALGRAVSREKGGRILFASGGK